MKISDNRIKKQTYQYRLKNDQAYTDKSKKDLDI
jgi:hypothetical protein